MKTDDTTIAKELFGWKARRSGAAITITAEDESGMTVIESNIDSIECGGPFPVATHLDGRKFALLTRVA